VADRRLPDGLQAALEAKEGLAIQPGGRVLASITLQHVLGRYPKLGGMTATARPAAAEFYEHYGLRVLPIPSHRPSIREDLPDLVFTHREAKLRALVREITKATSCGRPVLVGTGSVEESDHLAGTLRKAGIACRVLNAKNDEAEAEVIAGAGAVGGVTIATNMAGRGTDIRLGGADEKQREQVVALGGLYVIGTNRHESRRIDDQLRGRAGRQGDPGTSRFFVSLDDPSMVRFGIEALLPARVRPSRQDAALQLDVVRREMDRLQRIVEGQNQEIRTTLCRYTALVEKQRASLHVWRMQVLIGEADMEVFAARFPERCAMLIERVGASALAQVERAVTLHHIDDAWADHLAFVAELREGIHLVGIGGLDPLHEFHKQVAPAFRALHGTIEDRTAETFERLRITDDGLLQPPYHGPSATWTYLVNDRALTDLQQALFGHSSSAYAAGAVLTAWPLLLLWGLWQRFSKEED